MQIADTPQDSIHLPIDNHAQILLLKALSVGFHTVKLSPWGRNY